MNLFAQQARNIPPFRGIWSLVEQIDLRVASRPARPPYPVIVFTEEVAEGSDRQVVEGFYERLRRTPVRAVSFTASDLDGNGLSALFDDVPGKLRVPLPRLRICHTALKAAREQGSGIDGDVRQRKIRDKLYDDLCERRPVLGWLAGLVSSGIGMPEGVAGWLRTVVASVLVSLPRWVYSLWLDRSPGGLSWVPVLLDEEGRFLESVAALPKSKIDLATGRLLMTALLRDLDRAIRPSWFTVGPYRRAWPFVLLFPEAAENKAQRDFIEACAMALRSFDAQSQGLRRTPVLVLAAYGRNAAPSEAQEPSADGGKLMLERAAIALGGAAGHGRKTDNRIALNIPLSGTGTESDSDRENLEFHTRPKTRRSNPLDRLRPALAYLLTIGLIASPTLAVRAGYSGATDPCLTLWTPQVGGERIGLTDGKELFSGNKELIRLEQTIASRNDAIVKRYQPENHVQPYQTVVFFAPLTVPKSSGHLGLGSIDELRGVALAQQDAEEKAKAGSQSLPIRVLIANPGDRFAYGPDVAERIVDCAEKDPTLSAVIGIAQSRHVSRMAIQSLAPTGMPIISSTSTGDLMAASSSHYYQIAPRNDREAHVIADFIKHYPTAEVTNGKAPIIAKRVVVIEDPRDEFSQNLAEDFRKYYQSNTDKIVKTFDYGPDEAKTMALDPKLNGVDEQPESSAHDLVKDLCMEIGKEPTLVFYASRAQQLNDMLNQIPTGETCGGRLRLGIMGGDEFTRYITDGTIKIQNYPFAHFYHAGHSVPGKNITNEANDFTRKYRDWYKKDPDDSGAAMAYDAFTTAENAINKAYHDTPNISIVERARIDSKLSDGEVNFTGVTGLIAVNGSHNETRVPANKPIYVLDEKPTGPDPVLSCGRFAKEDEITRWGPHQEFNCPRDPGP